MPFSWLFSVEFLSSSSFLLRGLYVTGFGDVMWRADEVRNALFFEALQNLEGSC